MGEAIAQANQALAADVPRCAQCGKEFQTRQGLGSHMYRAHGAGRLATQHAEHLAVQPDAAQQQGQGQKHAQANDGGAQTLHGGLRGCLGFCHADIDLSGHGFQLVSERQCTLVKAAARGFHQQIGRAHV